MRKDTARRLTVDGLERGCRALDVIPAPYIEDGRLRFDPRGCWGCRLGLAKAAARLDARWHVGHWRSTD